jgi:hypothetical protein
MAKAHMLANVKVITTEKPVTITLLIKALPTLLISNKKRKLSKVQRSGSASGLL